MDNSLDSQLYGLGHLVGVIKTVLQPPLPGLGAAEWRKTEAQRMTAHPPTRDKLRQGTF